MSRLILAFVLLVFAMGAANASVLMTCCPQQSEQTNQASETPPCHEHHHEHHKSSSPVEKSKSAGCMCAYTCVSKIALDDMNFQGIGVMMNPLSPSWTNDIGISLVIRPESPPPKA